MEISFKAESAENCIKDGFMDEAAAASAPSQEGVTYYAVHIPNTVAEEKFPRLFTDKSSALQEVKKHKKGRFKPCKTRWEAMTFSLHGSDVVLENTSSEVDGPPMINSPKANGPNSGTIADAEKPSSFKGPKAQDLVRLRRAIEIGDLRLVKNTVWDNPRYLVSSGDTPAILQVGSWYNALHVAAKSKNAAMTELILETVSNPNFFRLLYNSENDLPEEDTSIERAAVMLDLYLNTPDKGVNETPLHFAAKFGALDVVKVLVSYSQCNRLPLNKLGQTPLDIVCSRIPNASYEFKKEIIALLENEYYVPVLRSADQSMQPIVGAPFSPKEPPILDSDPTRPAMEIHAFAGPMRRKQAEEFRKQWRTPQRVRPVSGERERVHQSCPPAIHLKDCEKGLERAGRVLAAQYHVPWLEFWPFLDTFVNLASPEGLALLEDYLKGRFLSALAIKGDLKSPPWRQSIHRSDADESGDGHVLNVSHDSLNSTGIEPEVLSPVSNLCATLKALTIMDDSLGSGHGCGSPDSVGSISPANPSPRSPASNGVSSPSLSRSQAFFDGSSRKATTPFTPVSTKLPASDRKEENLSSHDNQETWQSLPQPSRSSVVYVERSLRLFARRIAVMILLNARGGTVPRGAVSSILRPEVHHIQNLVKSYMADDRFRTVGYQVAHSRIASCVAELLAKDLSKEECDSLLSCLSDFVSKPDDKGSSSSEEDDEAAAGTMYRQPVPRLALYVPEDDKAAECCIALQTAKAVERIKEAGLERTAPKTTFLAPTQAECIALWDEAQACSCEWRVTQKYKRTGSSLKRERERLPPKMEVSTGRDIVPRQLQFESDSGMEDKDEFYTPPTSPVKTVADDEFSSDEEMGSPKEAPDVFIMGQTPTKVDVNVLNAISTCEIKPRSHPNIYRWRHSVELYSAAERERWLPANFTSRVSEHSDSPCTPSTPAASVAITADLSPSTPKSSNAACRPTLAHSSRSNQLEDRVASSPIWSRITGPLSPTVSTVARCNTPSAIYSPSWSRLD